MSTFSGINTALSSLIAQRQALEVAGQNIANASTVGYTRQRSNLTSIEALSTPSMYASLNAAGNGTTVSNISRLGDAFLDARLRTETGTSSYLAVRSSTYAKLESTVGEPGKTGLSSQLSAMWADWGAVSNTPGSGSSRSVLMQDSQAVINRLATLYNASATEWQQSRTDLTSMVSDVNSAAASVADLNSRILAITNSGGSANELMDQRDTLVTQLSGLTGAQARTRDNGVVDVLIGGNAIVDGAAVHGLVVTGASTFAAATGGTGTSVAWASDPTIQLPMTSGKIAGVLSVLAPPNGGNGGLLTEAAASYNAVATSLATAVNAVHSTGKDLNGNPAGNFFTLDATQPAALGLSLAVTSTDQIAAASATVGGLDGSLADKMSQLGSGATSPDATWGSFVVQLGVASKSATSRATVAESARATAEGLQLSQTSVNTDEETVNMLGYQRAYQGAARVLTAIDEMLDTLINRTGTVGR